MRAYIVFLAVCVVLAYSAPYPAYGPGPRSYGPGPAAYGPRSYGPAPGAYNRGAYGPAPRAYGPAPRAYGPAPGAYRPAPAAYGPAPGVYGRNAYGPSRGPAPGSYGGPSSSYGSSAGRSFGREMHYTVQGPGNEGTMKVKETHVTMDRQMNPQEAEQAMKNIMGSMGDSRGQFQDFVRGIGLNIPHY